MHKKRAWQCALALAAVLACALSASAQAGVTQITGIVRDSVTSEPIPFATIGLVGSDEGAITNDKGGFVISTNAKFKSLRVSVMGYATKEMPVKLGQGNTIIVLMQPTSVTLDEVVVKRTKEKYSKKGNPAVEFVKRLMVRKHDHDPKQHEYYSYEKYEKVSYGLDNVENTKSTDFLLKKFDFLSEYMYTSEVSGKRVLPVAVKEKVSREFFRHSPKTHKELILGTTQSGIDDSFDQASVKKFIDDVFREIDIFGNDVAFMQNRFVSPLSNIGVNFYKYYLNDTVVIDGEPCIDLSFVPFNSQTFGFTGRVYVVAADTSMFIKRVVLNVPTAINVNYVKRVYITQDYAKAYDGSRLKLNDNMTVEFSVIPGAQGLYVQRSTSYKDYDFNAPSDLSIFDKEGDQIMADGADKMPSEFWTENRRVTTGPSENSVQRMMNRLRKNKLYFWSEKVILALATGYVNTAKNKSQSKFDFGPVNTLVSGNSLEGVRMRLGGMTTANLNPQLFARGYVAYGTRDEKLKYQARLEYSFNKKNYHNNEYPIHSVTLMHQYDVDQVGQHYSYTNQDNMFLWLKRQKNDKLMYLRKTMLDYTHERKNGFTFALGFVHEVHEASRYMQLEDGNGNQAKRYTEAGFRLKLRYAPHEKFYQTRSYRIPINQDYPVFTLEQTYMPKGFLGGDFEVNKTQLTIQKRFWFSAFGYTDVVLQGAKLWSKVAYPDLLIPNANLSYTVQQESYSLMNAMEFANDEYLSWDITYWANGALLNYVPLIKYLKLREVFSFRGMYGHLSHKNDPSRDANLYRFPADTRCEGMGKKPYMEVGVGLDNILTFLRVDYVWRLTYRDNPGIDKSGVRIQLHFTF